jgi:2-dehydro-3-deoxygalactonokinase
MGPVEGRAMNFVACDWGTSRLRVRWRGPDGLREVASDDGASRLAAQGGDRARAFEGALREALQRLGAPAGLPVLVSGMASSSIGWQELPYARLPFSLEGSGVVGRWLDRGDGSRVCLISGVRDQSDMMRGEETQVLGWAEQVEHAGHALPVRATLVLPGTHSKHLRIESGSLTAISTFMTGELFEVLCRHSVLRHSVAPEATSAAADTAEVPVDSGAFSEGVRASARPGLAAALFQVRSRQVLSGCDPASNRSFLSGLLIGAELRSLEAGDGTVILAAGKGLREAYTQAASECGLSGRWTAIEVDGLAELGQRRLRRRWDSGHGLVASPDPDPCVRP